VSTANARFLLSGLVAPPASSASRSAAFSPVGGTGAAAAPRSEAVRPEPLRFIGLVGEPASSKLSAGWKPRTRTAASGGTRFGLPCVPDCGVRVARAVPCPRTARRSSAVSSAGSRDDECLRPLSSVSATGGSVSSGEAEQKAASRDAVPLSLGRPMTQPRRPRQGPCRCRTRASRRDRNCACQCISSATRPGRRALDRRHQS
jgi:hypothetical protein